MPPAAAKSKGKARAKKQAAAPEDAQPQLDGLLLRFNACVEADSDNEANVQTVKAWVAVLEATASTLRAKMMGGSLDEVVQAKIFKFGTALDEAMNDWKAPTKVERPPISRKTIEISQAEFDGTLEILDAVKETFGQIHMVNYLASMSVLQATDAIMVTLATIKRLTKDIKTKKPPPTSTSEADATGEKAEGAAGGTKRKRKVETQTALESFVLDTGLPTILKFWMNKIAKGPCSDVSTAADVQQLVEALKQQRQLFLNKYHAMGTDDDTINVLEQRFFVEETKDCETGDRPIFARLSKLLDIYKQRVASAAVKGERGAVASVTTA